MNDNRIVYYFSPILLPSALSMLVLLFVIPSIPLPKFGYTVKDIVLSTALFLAAWTAFFPRIRALVPYFSRRPALIITPETIVDNYNQVNYRTQDIRRIDIKEVSSSRSITYVIVITLTDPDGFARSLNPVSRLRCWINERFTGRSFEIPTEYIQADEESLLSDLNRHLDPNPHL